MERPRRALTVLFAGLLLTAAIVATGTTAGQTDGTARTNDSTWTAPRSDDGRTGATTDDGPHPYGTAAWATSAEGRVWSGVVSDGEAVYAAWHDGLRPDGAIHSWNAASGSERWTQTGIGNAMGSPTLVGDRLYAATVGRSGSGGTGSEESRTGLYALNAPTGAVVWRHNDTFSEPVYADGRLVASVYEDATATYPWEARNSGVERVTALGPETGNHLWTTNVSGSVLAAANGSVIVGSEADDTLYALDVDDGSIRWRATVETDVALDDSVAATGDSVFLVSQPRTYDELDDPTRAENPTLSAYSMVDGSKRWTSSLAYDYTDRPPAYATAPAVSDGTVYVTTPHAAVALDADTGAEAWRFETAVALESDPAIGNGTLYVAGQWDEHPKLKDVVYALDAGTGSEDWAYQERSPTQTASYWTSVAGGRLFVTGHGSSGAPTTHVAVYEGTSDQPAAEHRVTDDAPVAENERPTARTVASPGPGDDGYYEQNVTVTLNASASTDDGEIVSYEWDVDSDGEYERSGTTIEVRTPDGSGAATDVALRVTDDDGETDVAFVNLETGC